jgi:hypothetical protein
MPTLYEPAVPSQNPIPKQRNSYFVEGFHRSRHASSRQDERTLSNDEVFQTIAAGHQQQDPKGNPDVSHFVLNSRNHPSMRRRVVADVKTQDIITVYPREDIPAPAPQTSNKPTTTKANKKAQLAKKRARSAQANGG